MNTIRNSLRMARKDLKVLFKDRGQLAVVFALPLLFSLLYGGIAANRSESESPGGESGLVINAYLVNGDQGPYGAQVEEALRGIGPLRLHALRSVDVADEKVADGQAAAAIIIPADFSAQLDANQPVGVQLLKDPAQQAEARAVAGILNNALTELSVMAEIQYGIRAVFEKTGALEGVAPEVARAAQAQTMGAIWTGVQEIRQSPAITVQSQNLAGEVTEISYGAAASAFFTPSFSTMFAFFLIGVMAESIVREKEAGSFRRLLAAPVHRGTIVAGKMLAFVGVVYLQMLLVFGVSNALFGMPLGDSPLGLLALTLALALAATGLGLLLGSIARTSKQAGIIGMLLGFVLLLASGLLGLAPSLSGNQADLGLPTEGLQYYVSQLTPHIHAVEGYVKLILEGAGVVDVLPNILILLGFGVVFFLIGVWRFRYE
ncbi:MAG: ABC transporter permease [Anaerolineae bacterium]|jgi:ABC-2 type transport system permease protein